MFKLYRQFKKVYSSFKSTQKPASSAGTLGDRQPGQTQLCVLDLKFTPATLLISMLKNAFNVRSSMSECYYVKSYFVLMFLESYLQSVLYWCKLKFKHI